LIPVGNFWLICNVYNAVRLYIYSLLSTIPGDFYAKAQKSKIENIAIRVDLKSELFLVFLHLSRRLQHFVFVPKWMHCIVYVFIIKYGIMLSSMSVLGENYVENTNVLCSCKRVKIIPPVLWYCSCLSESTTTLVWILKSLYFL